MTHIQDSGRRPDSTSAAVARTAQDKLGESAATVGDKATEVAQTAKEQAGQVVGEATGQARDLIGEFKDQLQDQAGSQTRRLAGNVRRLSDELREMSENGRADSTAAGLVGRVADGGRQVADRLEERGPEGLIGDLQDFARRRPGVFLAGAALAGFAAARVVHGLNAAGSDGTGPRAVPAAGGDDYPAPAPAVPPDVSPAVSPAARPAVEPGSDGADTAPGAGPGPYADPLDTYGQSQPPHVTPAPQGAPAPPAYPPASRPETGGAHPTEGG
ncbi:hypothetical protein ABZ934_02695 [Streptomyces sp. NPDC046557]|uniref:hypothetical protein n=1 Tax=Streptomyces sp. NPDC046557 TaxID=3155372 RepID=UPI0034042FAA